MKGKRRAAVFKPVEKRPRPSSRGGEEEEHHCTESTCTLFLHTHDKTCPLTGIHYAGHEVSSYDKNDYRTWKSGTSTVNGAPVPFKKRRGKVASEESLEERAANMVRLLLFSNARVECNRVAIKEMEQKADGLEQAYIEKQLAKHQQPFWTDLYRFRGHIMSERLPLVIFEPSTSLISYYSAVIMQMWRHVQEHHVPLKDKKYDEHGIEIVPRLNFDHVSLAILYMMRQGIKTLEGLELLPRDAFLEEHLPGANLFSHFGLFKNDMSKGEHIIGKAIENCADLRKMVLNMETLPVHHQDEQKIVHVEGYRVQAKVSSNGQLLFMPKSRSIPAARKGGGNGEK